MRNDAVIAGHDVLAVERFQDATRHMIIYEVRVNGTSFGARGDHIRLFLSDEDYADMKVAEKHGFIKIRSHADVIEGHILPGKKKKRRH